MDLLLWQSPQSIGFVVHQGFCPSVTAISPLPGSAVPSELSVDWDHRFECLSDGLLGYVEILDGCIYVFLLCGPLRSVRISLFPPSTSSATFGSSAVHLRGWLFLSSQCHSSVLFAKHDISLFPVARAYIGHSIAFLALVFWILQLLTGFLLLGLLA